MCVSIWLKFGTHIGDPKANTKVKLRINPINIEGVIISDLMQEAKLNFYHAYRVNRFKTQAENWYEARVNIRKVPLGDDQVRDNRHMKFNPTSVKLHN